MDEGDRYELTEMAEQVWHDEVNRRTQKYLPGGVLPGLPAAPPAWAGTCPIPTCTLPMIVLGVAPFPAPVGWECTCFGGHIGVVEVGHPTLYRVVP